MTKFCEQCGTPVNEGERFCPKCGAKISETTTSQQPDWKQDQPRLTFGKLEISFISKRKLIIMGIFIVIIILLALIKG